ncbi:MAG: hypothetical protein PHG15_00725 [Acinetobacter sp.]|uniref:hypothetical protein n=1 Tax=Acinetobacter sp. TaxID=472 RepID=UPI0026030B41|nr:hypothetical protein [Acinetobacter sp.]MDD2944342.1 hypothetical protein [Acinetobacter sp.]
MTLDQYKKNIEFKLGIIEDVERKFNQFEKEKRLLTKQELFDKTCKVRDLYKETAWYANQYPDYKLALKNDPLPMGLEVYKIESTNSMYSDLIKSNGIECNENAYVPSPYEYSLLRWKELPKVKDQSDLTITYIDSENIDFISRKPLVKSVKIKELFKKYPDNVYIEQDFIIYCDSNEYSITRNKIFRSVKGETPVNAELKYDPPLGKKAISGTMQPVGAFTCK